MFQQLSDEYTRQTGKDLCNFSTDGDATRRQIFNELLSHDLDPTSPLGEMLCDIKLLDLEVGAHNETVSYDPKHWQNAVGHPLLTKVSALQEI